MLDAKGSLHAINIMFLVIWKGYWSGCSVHFICKVKCSTPYIHTHCWQVMVRDGSRHCLQSVLSLWPCLSGDKNTIRNSPPSLSHYFSPGLRLSRSVSPPSLPLSLTHYSLSFVVITCLISPYIFCHLVF